MSERLFCPECPRVVKYDKENDTYSCKGCGQTYILGQLRSTGQHGMSADEEWLRHMDNRFNGVKR